MDVAFGKGGSGPRGADTGAAQEERRGKSGSCQPIGNQNASARRSRPRPRSSAAISTLIEGEIIPQLLVAHRLRPERAVSQGSAVITAQDVANFAAMPLVLQADELLVHVEGYLDRGVAVDSIFVDLLAPAARRLGDLWEEDACDFLDVTIGLWRLQEVMREIAWGSPVITGPLTAPYRALFSPMPGEQHSFGSTMVHEVFVRAAWDSEVLVAPEFRQLIAKVANKPYDLVGLTLSCDASSDNAMKMIKAIRSVSMCQEVKVLIGGHAVNANPALVEAVGADGFAPDAPGALALANRLVGEVARRFALSI